jgi:hypothetical protein
MLGLVVALVATTVAPATAAAVDAQALPSVPCAGRTPPPDVEALIPSEVGARYDLQPLWDAGFRGQGVRTECCVAGPGYDLTTGLGQLDVAALTAALIARGTTAAPPQEVPVLAPRFTG